MKDPEIEAFFSFCLSYCAKQQLRTHIRPCLERLWRLQHSIISCCVCRFVTEELVQSWQQRQVTDDVDAQMHGLPTG